MARVSLLIVAVVWGALASGCSRERTISGEVFVVTKAGSSVKLALVEVRALDYDVICRAIRHAAAEASDSRRELELQVEVAEQAVHTDNAAIEAATRTEPTYGMSREQQLQYFEQQAREAAVTGGLAEEPRVPCVDLPDVKPCEGSAVTASEARSRKLISDFAAMTKLHAKASALDSPGFYFERLPTAGALAATKTDADGRFTISVPIEAAVVLVAHAHRELNNHDEDYYWILKGPVDADTLNHVMLSNDNMLSSSRASQVLSTAFP